MSLQFIERVPIRSSFIVKLISLSSSEPRLLIRKYVMTTEFLYIGIIGKSSDTKITRVGNGLRKRLGLMIHV